MLQSIISRFNSLREPLKLIGYPHTLTRWWFIRGLGLMYLSAFWSMATQITGLVGANGILPVQEQLARISQAYSYEKYGYLPTLFWLDASDTALISVCLIGIVSACFVTLNVLVRPALIVCYVCYLSITHAGQDFTSFQWDTLLLESSFLALFLYGNSPITVFLYRLLIARFMFMSGVVKIASGDPSWINLTALNYHYLTQPLPSPLGYYAYFLPEWWQKLCVSGVLFIELVVPFLVFFPRPFRLFSAWCFILLQVSIMLTGNYTFFNLTTLLLCLFLFDDSDLAKISPRRLVERLRQSGSPATVNASIGALVWAGFVIIVLSTYIWMAQTHRTPSKPLAYLIETASAFVVANNYGPFAVMTTDRDEIIIEGSDDGEHWLEYGFTYKPDALDKPLGWNIPHQPRLDWQLWFAALTEPNIGGWFDNFMLRLKAGSPEVLGLLAVNPFPKHPPAYLRAILYRYTFVPPEQRAETGQLWHREKLRPYWP